MTWTRLSSASSRTLGRHQGARVTLIKVDRVRDDDALETILVETPYPVFARIARRMVRDQTTGLLAEADHRRVLVAAAELPQGVEPKKGDKVSIRGSIVTILSVRSRETAGQPILYQLEVSN